jgi:hypothetical protein
MSAPRAIASETNIVRTMAHAAAAGDEDHGVGAIADMNSES